MLPPHDATDQTTPFVREATPADLDYVLEAFENALSPYYDGDHLAHARRLITTHLSGGSDPRGRLSTKQLLLILCRGEEQLGVLNLVFKRQATCKISPLLLYPGKHHNQGLGTLLLNAAEAVARNGGARQIYCTVAEKNEVALSFFRQFGFVTCGRSEGQYKNGVTEVLLRRALPDTVDDDGPGSIISVGEVRTATEWTPVRQLLLSGVAGQVDGADTGWLDALWAATPTVTHATSAAEETTWVFGAKDRLDRCRAGAVGTCKKGESVKVMPVSATDIDAFRAMVVDLPSLLCGKGRKAYLHIAPDPDEVAVLQETGWRFEALLPGAYSDTVVTQQWGCALGEDVAVKNLRIHNRFLELIRTGEKTLEIRVGYNNIKKIHPGDQLKLISRTQSFVCHVDDVRTYQDFADLAEHEEMERALPGMDTDEALTQLRRIYPKDKEKLGVYVLDLKVSTV